MKVAELIAKGGAIDVDAEHGVQLDKSADGRTIWVNVDGVCVVRIHRSKDAGISVNPSRMNIPKEGA